LGATRYIQDEKNQRFMGIMAGVLLVVFGSFYFKKPVKKSEDTIELASPSTKNLILKGFFLNLLNPAVWLLWLGNVTAVSKTFNYSVIKMLIYFGITLGLVLTVEIFKASLASKIKRYLTEKLMRMFNYTTGVLLIAFGIGLMYRHYFS
jgi:threonine/homoserine/homoserine lactone efflux protein